VRKGEPAHCPVKVRNMFAMHSALSPWTSIKTDFAAGRLVSLRRGFLVLKVAEVPRLAADLQGGSPLLLALDPAHAAVLGCWRAVWVTADPATFCLVSAGSLVLAAERPDVLSLRVYRDRGIPFPVVVGHAAVRRRLPAPVVLFGRTRPGVALRYCTRGLFPAWLAAGFSLAFFVCRASLDPLLTVPALALLHHLPVSV